MTASCLRVLSSVVLVTGADVVVDDHPAAAAQEEESTVPAVAVPGDAVGGGGWYAAQFGGHDHGSDADAELAAVGCPTSAELGYGDGAVLGCT